MTTDNRTNEPTEAQVEAAVHAAWVKSREFRGVGGQAEFAPPWEFQQVIRAALVAAQGAAPQAECDCGAGPGSAVCKKVCATRTPVLPSSGVDEAALAEVIATATYDWSQQRLEFWRKPKSVEPPGDLDTFIARAVAAWLKGQGR